PTTTLDKVAKAMSERKLDSIVVVDESGNLKGVVNSTDLLRAQSNGHKNGSTNGAVNGSANGSALAHTASEAIMNASVLTIAPGQSLAEAADLMVANHLSQLIVVQQENGHQKPIGVLSTTDIAQA
ncbi:MAG: CBS domain-containing protein, partial [Caldilineaceae bacterium]|nr:CBS domain-containing protein [Caldilineaceae bacterium]